MGDVNFFYGSYDHQVGEVYARAIEIRPLFTDENVRWGSTVRYDLAGDFCADPATPLDSAAVDAKIAELKNAYLYDYKDFGFKIDGELADHHVLNDDVNNLSGNRVMARSWVYRGPNELANTRSYNISLGATFRTAYSQIVMYRERTSQRGTGGPRWTYRPRFSGPPIREDIHQQTPVEMIQQGIIVGLDFRPALPLPYWPSDEVQPDRFIERFSPKLHGHQSFERATHYALRYRYRFLLPTVPADEPIVWP